MSKKIEFSIEEKERIKKLFKEDGFSCRKIARLFNIKNAKPIYKVLDEFGLDHSRGNLTSYEYYYEDGIYSEDAEKKIIQKIKEIPEANSGH